MTKERILYFIMGAAAAAFASADVIAEFDRDPDTKTATYYVKRFARHPVGRAIVALGVTWLGLHFLWEDFPL